MASTKWALDYPGISVAVVFSSLILGLLLIRTLSASSPPSPPEPPLLKPPHPIFGHLPGLLRHGMLYMDVLARQYHEQFPEGIFTVSLFGKHIYIVMTPGLLAHTQNKSRLVSGWEVLATVTASFTGRGRKYYDRLVKNSQSRKIPNYHSENHKLIYGSLNPGKELDRMRVAFVDTYVSFIPPLETIVDKSGSYTFDFYEWLRESFTNASARLAWGKDNPFSRDPTLWKAFTEFDDNAGLLMTRPLPRILVRKGYLARERAIGQIRDFMAESDEAKIQGFGPLMRHTSHVLSKWGFTADELASNNLGMIIGLASNTAPAAANTLIAIVRDPSLLSSVRAELDALVQRSADGTTATFDAADIRSHCPLFVSAAYETMRLTSSGSTARVIAHDPDNVSSSPGKYHILTSPDKSTSWSLKKGEMMFMAGGLIHGNSAHYANPTTFDATRYLEHSIPETQIPGLFRSFGGGASICGGRYLAVAEILAVVSSIILRFDIEKDGGSGGWQLPDRRDCPSHAAVTPPPGGKMPMTIRRRAGWEGVRWINSHMKDT
ncbi:hypothetical protein PFICI_09512 [Pestalotiopsis fici W106-1]|uniref:Cytochrome P450 n=1 Tax=Pestalotiopsis fici (strain W106-1 / CGMCC3.15140) TaxID=1229662 RepID=W3X0U2_PESFW|nr:uncharacterized protein PFICI_09512 [Pestalotiopsis fici W106-1]ETS79659.1 hypothetical protein PFICI_09512 [Pestalotiopsis fici W106-1]